MQTSVHPITAPPAPHPPLVVEPPSAHIPLTPSEVSAPPPAPYTLHFVEWQCGHHQQRPADIPVQTPAQGLLIAQAVAAAISQPGHARAVLMDESHGVSIYITDDYVDDARAFEDQRNWSLRPCVVHGTEDEVSRVLLPEFAEARDWVFGGDIKRWNGDVIVYTMEDVLSTSTPEQIMANYVQGIDLYEQRQLFELPPRFRTAADVLAEFAEIAEDGADTGGRDAA